MISALDGRKNVGIILMLSGIILMTVWAADLILGAYKLPLSSIIGDLIVGEVLLFVGFGLNRGRPYAHLTHLFEDCESRLGILCSITSGFGLAYLISSAFSIASGDVSEGIVDIVAGMGMLIASYVITNHKGTKAANIAHKVMIVCSILLFSFLCMGVALLWAFSILYTVECVIHLIIMGIVLLYLFDASVKADIKRAPQVEDASADPSD